jgi:glyceraldehyde 3-phosphate dehydrogenase
MKKRIAINGFGRIGRATFRIIKEKYSEDLEVVAVNDLLEGEKIAHLLKYDSVYGSLEDDIYFKDNHLNVGDLKVKIFAQKDPLDIPWQEMEVDVVLECTGLFTNYDGAKKHIDAGAKKVIISAPSKDSEKIPSFVLGVNEENYNKEEHSIVDMGSCTTNCLAPLAKILNDRFGIISGMMTTVHSYTLNQNLLDGAHKDLRRARSATVNIIPTTTGAAKALGRVIPELDGKISGMAMRVPTASVSVVDLVCFLRENTTREEVLDLLKEEAKREELKNILKVEERPLVSSDFIKSTYSLVVDEEMVSVKDSMVKVLAWYDNEWGYSTRLAEFAKYITQTKNNF